MATTKMTARLGREDGSVLITVVVLIALLGATMTALLMSSWQYGTVTEGRSSFLQRLHAANAGLERMRVAVCEAFIADGNWPADIVNNHGGVGPTLDIGSNRVETFVEARSDAAGDYYLLTARASDGVGVTEVAMTQREGIQSYAKYMLFCVKDIMVGAKASFTGEVYSGSNVKFTGNDVHFYDPVSAKLDFIYDGASPATVKFWKGSATGISKDAPPVTSVYKPYWNPEGTEGGIVIHPDQAWVRDLFMKAYGWYPTEKSFNASITFNRNQMQVTIGSANTINGMYKTVSTSLPLGQNTTIYVGGYATVKGDISRRISLFVGGNVYVDGALRYVDDSGEPQYKLYKKDNNGNLTTEAWFDPVTRTWEKGNSALWDDTKKWSYMEDPDWDTIADLPKDEEGKKQDPTLGIITSGEVILKNAKKYTDPGALPNNVEVHASIYAPQGNKGTIKPESTSATYMRHNLVMVGGMVLDYTSPLSKAFLTRLYKYDHVAATNPPPAFPQLRMPVFANWQILRRE